MARYHPPQRRAVAASPNVIDWDEDPLMSRYQSSLRAILIVLVIALVADLTAMAVPLGRTHPEHLAVLLYLFILITPLWVPFVIMFLPPMAAPVLQVDRFPGDSVVRLLRSSRERPRPLAVLERAHLWGIILLDLCRLAGISRFEATIPASEP